MTSLHCTHAQVNIFIMTAVFIQTGKMCLKSDTILLSDKNNSADLCIWTTPNMSSIACLDKIRRRIHKQTNPLTGSTKLRVHTFTVMIFLYIYVRRITVAFS